MTHDFNSRLSLPNNRRLVKQVEGPKREEPEWDPITNNIAPNARYGKKMSSAGVGNALQQSLPVESAEIFKTGRKMLQQPVREQPIAPTPPEDGSPMAYRQTARMKSSKRYEGNSNCILGDSQSVNVPLRVGRGPVAVIPQGNGNIITGEGVNSEPVRRKHQYGYSNQVVGERPWALHYEGPQ